MNRIKISSKVIEIKAEKINLGILILLFYLIDCHIWMKKMNIESWRRRMVSSVIEFTLLARECSELGVPEKVLTEVILAHRFLRRPQSQDKVLVSDGSKLFLSYLLYIFDLADGSHTRLRA